MFQTILSCSTTFYGVFRGTAVILYLVRNIIPRALLGRASRVEALPGVLSIGGKTERRNRLPKGAYLSAGPCVGIQEPQCLVSVCAPSAKGGKRQVRSWPEMSYPARANV